MKLLWRGLLAPVESEWEAPMGEDYQGVQKNLSRILLCLLITLVAILALWWRLGNLPAPGYNMVNAEGKDSAAIKTLILPALSNEKVRRWTSRAVQDTFSLNFVNMQERLGLARTYFTPEGWEFLASELRRRKILETIRDNQLDVVLTPTEIPTILQQFVYNDTVYWKIQVPVLLVYTGSKRSYTEEAILSMLVSQVSTLEDVEGLAIQSIRQHGG